MILPRTHCNYSLYSNFNKTLEQPLNYFLCSFSYLRFFLIHSENCHKQFTDLIKTDTILNTILDTTKRNIFHIILSWMNYWLVYQQYWLFCSVHIYAYSISVLSCLAYRNYWQICSWISVKKTSWLHRVVRSIHRCSICFPVQTVRLKKHILLWGTEEQLQPMIGF